MSLLPKYIVNSGARGVSSNTSHLVFRKNPFNASFFSEKEFSGALQKTRIGENDKVDTLIFLGFSALSGGDP